MTNIFRLTMTLACLGLLASNAHSDGAIPVPVSAPPTQRDGGAIYHSICQGCHMPQGEGAKGAAAYPALAGNPRLAAAAYPIYLVAKGQAGMPSFQDMLNDAEIAGVVGYIRTHFSNQFAEPVTLQDVRKITQR